VYKRQILDTETASYECWRETYEEQGHVLSIEMWSANVGGYGYHVFHPFETLEKLTGRTHGWEDIHARRKQRYHDRVHAMDCLPGIRDAIAHAREAGLKTAIASSSESGIVRGHLKRLGLLQYFDVISCGDQVEAIKPDPAVYLAALERLEVPAAEAFAIEDSATGIAAAKAAGVYCIAVPNSITGTMDLSHADRLLPSLAAVPFHQLMRETRGEFPYAV